MYLLILSTPLLNIIITTFFGKFLGKKGIIIITLISLFFSWFISLLVFFEVIYNNYICTIKLFNWISLNFFNLDWGLLFDFITSVMLIVILTISILVHIFTIDYMGADLYFNRFYSYLTIFTFFMLLLVTADNFIQMFFGWEGVGIASYLLINFWYTRVEANKAAIKAMVVNRLGDLGIYFSLILIFFYFKSFSYYTIFGLVYWISKENFIIFDNIDLWLWFLNNKYFYFLNIQVNKISFLMFFIFLGAMSKSAQIGLHTWLPDAMEGPTPVSALLHAATMVTAGVFLLIRTSPILEFTSDLLFIITFFGAMTAFFTATIGIVQNDLKKVIAYSTCSQLGYMVFSCGLSGYSIALFHLFNHAFFKALLFLGAGSVIHSLADEQDMRKMGAMYKFMPITYIGIFIGSLALTGFPFLAGYYSKDIILELSFATFEINGIFSFWLGTFAAFFTSFYSVRLLYLVFLKKYNGPAILLKNVHESSNFILISLFILSICSIFSGYFFFDLFIGLGSNAWNNSLLLLKFHNSLLEAEFLPNKIKLIPTIFSFFGMFISLYIFIFINKFITIKNLLKNIRLVNFLYNKWYFDYIYGQLVKITLYFSYNTFYMMLDKKFFEFFFSKGIEKLFTRIIEQHSFIASGLVYRYIYLMFFFLSLFTVFFFDIYNNIFNFLSNFDFLFFLIFFILMFYSSITSYINLDKNIKINTQSSYEKYLKDSKYFWNSWAQYLIKKNKIIEYHNLRDRKDIHYILDSAADFIFLVWDLYKLYIWYIFMLLYVFYVGCNVIFLYIISFF